MRPAWSPGHPWPAHGDELTLILIFTTGLFLAYANGANDNFKGVATLLGSRTASYRRALLWATVTTALGSVAALILAGGLLAAFSGKGLVPPDVISNPVFPLAVALSAGLTVMLATRLGFPVSTTHALVGALVGAGCLASPAGVSFSKLGSGFLLPLLTSPFIAIALSYTLYPLARFARTRMGVEQETCVCVGDQIVGVVPGTPGSAQALSAVSLPVLQVGTQAECRVRYSGELMGVNARTLLDGAHYLSAGIVSFARGLNDTPKIAALLLLGGTLSTTNAVVGVAFAIAVGGLVSARGVAETMAHRVTAMNAGQGFTANMVTGLLVVAASNLGMPVSTTHVSCGSLFGIGAVTGQGHWNTIGQILLAWVTTLPVAGVLGAVFFLALGLLM